ncbi:hypothetical protein BH10BAC6_BH10BAC6_07320 [soil metagenome]
MIIVISGNNGSLQFMKTTLITLGLVALLLGACDRAKVLGTKPASGTVLTVSQALDPRSFGRTVSIRGTIGSVCQEEGCWMVITDGARSLRMSFKNEVFTVPLSLRGDVLVEGVVQEELVDEETARAIGSTIGLTDTLIQAMHGDQRIPLMTTTGIEFTE